MNNLVIMISVTDLIFYKLNLLNRDQHSAESHTVPPNFSICERLTFLSVLQQVRDLRTKPDWFPSNHI